MLWSYVRLSVVLGRRYWSVILCHLRKVVCLVRFPHGIDKVSYVSRLWWSRSRKAVGCLPCLKCRLQCQRRALAGCPGQIASVRSVWRSSWSQWRFPVLTLSANPVFWKRWTSPTCAAHFAASVFPHGPDLIAGKRPWWIWTCGSAYRMPFLSSAREDWVDRRMTIQPVGVWISCDGPLKGPLCCFLCPIMTGALFFFRYV